MTPEEYVAKLEEEIKELGEWKDNLIRADEKKSDHIDELEKENKNLREEIKELKEKYNLLKQRFPALED